MTDIFLGRQPVFNRERVVVGYELLFRHSDKADVAQITDGDAATAQVIEGAFMDIGLKQLAGRYPVFINLTRHYLLNPPPLPPKQVVFEILEDIELGDDIVEALDKLGDAGYRLALDDYEYDQAHHELLNKVHIVKLDVLALSDQRLEQQVRELRRYKVKLLAEKIEDESSYRRCRELGFDFFQGFYFSRPRIIRGRRLRANQITVVQLLRLVHKPDTKISDLEHLINQDVTLGYKLLRMMNSAYYNLDHKIDSVRHALVYIGSDAIRSWVSMLALTTLDDNDQGLMGISLVRARMCELLTPLNRQSEKDSFFTTGLFSVLDQFLQIPIDEIVRDLPLSEEVKSALLDNSGLIGEALRCSISFEQLGGGRGFQDMTREETAGHYLEAVEWAHQTTKALK
jgi:EAL and modified HD-GYP domain-containing signal transduction protein